MVSTDGSIQPDRAWENVQKREAEYPQIQATCAILLKEAGATRSGVTNIFETKGYFLGTH